MFEALLKPYLIKQYPCTTEMVHQQSNKHRRILDTLEPIISQHRLIVDKYVVKKDYEETNMLYPQETALRYQLFYQLSRLQKEVHSLSQDDRIDCLQVACNHWVKHLSRDQELDMKMRKEELCNAEIDKYFGDKIENSWIKI